MASSSVSSIERGARENGREKEERRREKEREGTIGRPPSTAFLMLSFPFFFARNTPVRRRPVEIHPEQRLHLAVCSAAKCRTEEREKKAGRERPLSLSLALLPFVDGGANSGTSLSLSKKKKKNSTSTSLFSSLSDPLLFCLSFPLFCLSLFSHKEKNKTRKKKKKKNTI